MNSIRQLALFSLLTLLLLPASASAATRVVMSDGSSGESWEKVLQKTQLPNPYRTVTITFGDCPGPTPSGRALGCAYPDGSIFIRRDSTVPPRLIFLHEFGHIVDATLSQEGRSSYRENFLAAIGRSGTPWRDPSNYDKQGEELFAEVWRLCSDLAGEKNLNAPIFLLTRNDPLTPQQFKNACGVIKRETIHWGAAPNANPVTSAR